MKSNYHVYQTSKISLIIFLLVGVSFSSFWGVLPSVSAQGITTETSTPNVAETPSAISVAAGSIDGIQALYGPTCSSDAYGKNQDSSFFADVLNLMGIPVSQFALDAFALWKPYENTTACWNPLATTYHVEWFPPNTGCTETLFNSIGVRNYSSKYCGELATARTLLYSGNGTFYKPIRDMLAKLSFDWQSISGSLNHWCNGCYSTSLTNQWQNLWNSGGGKCSGPSPNSPPDGYVSQSQTITFSWSAPGGCTFNGYTFRVNDSPNLEDTPIIDQGEGGTSRTETFGTELKNRDLWWGIRAANAPGGADWSPSRKFRIEESVTQPTHVSTTVNVPSIKPGDTAVVSVSLLDAPPNVYASAELSCKFNAALLEMSNPVPSSLFGADAVFISTTPKNGSFIAAIAGSNGNKVTTSGVVFTFNVKGLQVGETNIECTGRVSKGDNFAIHLPSSGSLLKVQIGHDPFGILRGQVVASKPVTVEVRKPDATGAIPLPVNGVGTFILPISPGNYTVNASAKGFLPARGSVTITDGNTITLPTFHLLAGDIDGNNVIDQLDALTIGMNYGGTTPTAADLNNDSVIDFLDLELLAMNYKKTGPVAWQ